MAGEVSSLQDALAAEHAAVFGYGVVGARLADGDRDAAEGAEIAHRGRRDATAALLSGRGEDPVAAEPAYQLPFPVTDRNAAVKLALQLEDRVAAAWRAALPATKGDVRRTALAALTDCALRAVRWRRVAAPKEPATVAFPGKP